MSSCRYIKKLFHQPLLPLSYIWVWMSPIVKNSETYLKVYYRFRTGKKLNLDHPVSFQEKTQWLKLHYKESLYTRLVDKYEVREYVAGKIGAEYLIPLYGVYESFDDIDFPSLPDQFVIKCTHDSGSTIVCRDKSSFNIKAARKRIMSSMKKDYFLEGREYPYKDVRHRIIVEKLLIADSDNTSVPDYKFFIFNGEPRMFFVAEGRFSKEGTRFTFYDMYWNELPIRAKGHVAEGAHTSVKKPECWEEMKEIVRKLSIPVPFVRIDLYISENKLYFGEYTFFHDGGVVDFEPDEWNYKLGKMIEIPTEAQIDV